MSTYKMINTAIRAVLVSSVLIAGSLGYAQTSEELGLKISKEAKARDTGWGDSESSMTMILRNKIGEEVIREIRSKILEQENDGDKSLTVFDQPRDVKGTAFLSFSHALKPDDQWLYLPSLKRVKRISSRNKSGPFMGSEFAFEDLSSFEIEKYTYKYIKDEACSLGECYVVEQYPADKNSGYTRRIVWIDKNEYRIDKIEFYDRKNSLLKTLTFNDYILYRGKFWRAHHQSMVNHQSHKETDLKLSNIKFRTGLKDSDFNKNALKRIR